MAADKAWLAGLRQTPFLLAVALVINAGVGRAHYARAAYDIDFLTLWSVPSALASPSFAGRPTPNIYDQDTRQAMGAVINAEARSAYVSETQARATGINASIYENRVESTGTPFIYAVVGMLTSGNFDRDASRFQMFSLLCLIAAVVVFCRVLQFQATATVLALAFFGLGFAPILADVRAANINQPQLLLLALFAWGWSRDRFVLAGACFGLAVALKPNLIYVAGALVVFELVGGRADRLLRTLAGTAAALVAAVGVSAAYFGSPRIWIDFIGSLPRTVGRAYPLAQGNYGLDALVAAGTGFHPAEIVALALVALLVTVLVTARDRRASGRDESFIVLGAGCALLLLGSRLAWIHYYTFTIPVALFLLKPLEGSAAPRATLRQGLALGALALLSDATHQMVTPWTDAVFANVAVLLLFVGCLLATRQTLTSPGKTSTRLTRSHGPLHADR